MDFTALAKLQKIDIKLMELKAAKGDLPEKVEQLKLQLSELDDKLNGANAELEQTKKDFQENKSEIEQFTHKLNKYQEQIYSVKTNKEYDAITSEIEVIENKINELELAGIELLEKEEQVGNQVKELQSQLDDLNNIFSTKETELKEKMAQTETEEKNLAQEREILASSLDKKLYYQYERIRKGKNGIALAEVHNYTCSECYTTIPAQVTVEIRKKERMFVCEVCGRILVTPYLNKKIEVEVN